MCCKVTNYSSSNTQGFKKFKKCLNVKKHLSDKFLVGYIFRRYLICHSLNMFNF